MNTRSSLRLTRSSNTTVIHNNVRKSARKSSVIILSSDDSDEEKLKPREVEVLRTPRKNKPGKTDFDEVSPVTPPKQKKLYDTVLSTSKQHEVIQENINTPSRLLERLVLISPEKKSVSSNRKSLFNENNEEVNTREKSVYQNARRALHSTAPTDMPGREKELEELRNFIDNHLNNETSGSLYVSGPPGTGKTAALNIILRDENIASEFKHVYVNCTAIKSPTAIYAKLVKELGVRINKKSEKDYLTGLENYLKKKHKMLILVLDEIDQLEYKDQSVLYTIFEWPSKANSRLVLIGIANALDLTDRTLPRLQARCELKPKLMHFAPYSKEQIVNIFKKRLESAGVLNVFSPVALQMLAGKVAAVSGDVRRALDIGRRVVELVDQNRNNKLEIIENMATALVDEESKAVELKEVLTVLNNVYGTSQNLVDDSDEAFPLQQKIIICSLLLMLKKAKNKDITVGKLHEVYRRVCTKRNILAVDQAEFVGLCSLIETKGIMRVTGRKEPRLNKVNLEWDEEEVASALKDKQLMSTILQDDSCLGKL